MYIIAIVAEKGGAGKTTLALALAVAASDAGMKAAVLDTDPQVTATKWTDRRTCEFPWVVPTHAARLSVAVKHAQEQKVEFLVIDTPPHAGTDAVEAAKLADVVAIPTEPHLFSLETLPKVRDLLKLAGDPPAFVVINKAGTQGKDSEQASAYVVEQGLEICPVVMHLRAAHRHAGNVGQAANEFDPGSKAAIEANQLYLYTLQQAKNTRSDKSHG